MSGPPGLVSSQGTLRRTTGSYAAPWSLSRVLLACLLFYAIAFPKGGIKIFEVPVTIGYIFTAGLMVLAILRIRGSSLPLDRLLVLLPSLALGLWSAVLVGANGTSEPGFTLAYFVAVLYMPVFGLVVFSPVLLDQFGQTVERIIVNAVRVIICYGIFLFFFKQITGQWIEIPYLTVNVDDVGSLDEKFINRGGIFKLISTYNNGNIFGVCMAIMAPLYLKLEPRVPFRWAMYAAMFLTLSRTAWIATLLIMVFGKLSQGIRPLTVLYLTMGVVLFGSTLLGVLAFVGLDLTFVFDSNLGGRAAQLDVLREVRIIPDQVIGALPEIVYLGMLKYYGLPGVLLFIVHILLPAYILRLKGVRLFGNTLASACLQGIIIYAIVAAADAAFVFIPVIMIFWMIAGMGLWYASQQANWLEYAHAPAR